MRWLALGMLLAAQAWPAPNVKDFDRAADKVLKERRYEWRTPKPKRPPEESSVTGNFFWEAMKAVAEGVKTVFEAVERFFNWVGDLFDSGDKDPFEKKKDRSDFDLSWLQALLWLALAGLLCYLAIQGWRAWQKAGLAEPLPAVAGARVGREEIAREELSGAEMPEEEWLRLAGELRAQGELRLALRAYFLASLSALGSRQWLRLKAFKSNRDYEIELRRRAPARADLLGLFSGQGREFERHWYGSWPVDEAGLSSFGEKSRQVRELAAP